jgi:hypothetical protein
MLYTAQRHSYARMQPRVPIASGTTNLIDILDRVLDKGLVIAGDIRVSLANVELLTIRIRLLVCSVDKAEQIGLNWWKYDPNLTSPALSALPADEDLTVRRRTRRTAVQGPALIAPGRRASSSRKRNKK